MFRYLLHLNLFVHCVGFRRPCSRRHACSRRGMHLRAICSDKLRDNLRRGSPQARVPCRRTALLRSCSLLPRACHMPGGGGGSIYVFVNMHECFCIYIYVCMYIYIYIYLSGGVTCMSVHVHVCVCCAMLRGVTCMSVHVHVCVCCAMLKAEVRGGRQLTDSLNWHLYMCCLQLLMGAAWDPTIGRSNGEEAERLFALLGQGANRWKNMTLRGQSPHEAWAHQALNMWACIYTYI